jgi:CspA family cold shock protein
VADAAAGASTERRTALQGVVRSYDPVTGDGTVLCDTDLAEYELARGAIEGSVFRMLRQGQRIVFDLDARGLATQVRMGSEADMGTPGFPQPDPHDVQHPQGG